MSPPLFPIVIIFLIIAALTCGTKLDVPQAHSSESHQGQVPCSAALARRDKVLDEVSAAIHAAAKAAA